MQTVKISRTEFFYIVFKVVGEVTEQPIASAFLIFPQIIEGMPSIRGKARKGIDSQ